MDDAYIGRFLDNRYEILEKIGTGGMAVVYKARCHRLNRFVAIKILKSDLAENEELRRRFHAESQAVAMLSHPNIVAVYDVNHTDDCDYIVMELIEGITLKQYINRKGILNWKEALHFTTQIVKALSHAHSRGIIHRDIKPHNIMILKDGSVKVADFGIARLLTTQNTLTQEALGSVHYISPEQAKGSAVDARSDLYSVGVVMYEMLTSRLPFEGDSPVSIAIQHISSIPLEPREINPNIPVGLAEITMHAMEPNLNLRYPSADAMLADLEEFRKNPSVQFGYSSVPLSEDIDSTRVLSNEVVKAAKTEPAPKKRSGNAMSRDRTTAEEYRRNRRNANRTTTLVGVFLIIVFLVTLFVFMWRYFFKDVLSPSEERITVMDFSGELADSVLNNPEYATVYHFTVEERESESVEAGYVISQDPMPHRSVVVSSDGVDMKLVVSSGTKTVLMPDLYNKDYRDAVNILENLKMDLVINRNAVPDDGFTVGYVFEQKPAADTELTRGMSVFITYSSGPEVELVEVPTLLNLTEQQAITRLQSYNLACQARYSYSDEYEVGRVMYQSYPAGEKISIHTKVIIEVSQGPEPTPDPEPEPVTPTQPEHTGSTGNTESGTGTTGTDTPVSTPETPSQPVENPGPTEPDTPVTDPDNTDAGHDLPPEEEGGAIMPNG